MRKAAQPDPAITLKPGDSITLVLPVIPRTKKNHRQHIKLACRRKLGAAGTYRGTLSAREFVAKHEDSPDMYCAGCAVVAAEWRGGVTFAPDECAHLRALVAYLSQGFVGPEARKGLDVLKGKLS